MFLNEIVNEIDLSELNNKYPTIKEPIKSRGHLPIYEIYEVTDRYFLSFHLDIILDNSLPLPKESFSIYYL